MYALANLYYILYLALQTVVVLFAIIYFLNLNKTSNEKKSVPFLLGLVLILICVFAASGDYWTYKFWYEMGFSEEIIEPTLHWVKLLVPNNYDIYRAVVWGTGIVLFYLICVQCRLDVTMSMFLFVVFYMSMYTYSRASVAIILIAFGFLLYNNNGFKLVYRILILLLFVWLGLMTHRSMLVAVPAILLAPHIKISKNNIWIMIALFPILSIFFNFIMPYVMGNILHYDYFGDKASSYLKNDSVEVTYLNALLQRFPILFMYFYTLFQTDFNKCQNKSVLAANSAAFLILYTAFLIATITTINASVLFYRTLNMSAPFIIVAITYAIEVNRRRFKNAAIVASLYVLFNIILNIRVFLLRPDFIIIQINERYFL